MGGGVSRSRYRMDEPDQIAVCETASSGWLASRSTQLGLLKAEGFRSKTALGEELSLNPKN